MKCFGSHASNPEGFLSCLNPVTQTLFPCILVALPTCHPLYVPFILSLVTSSGSHIHTQGHPEEEMVSGTISKSCLVSLLMVSPTSVFIREDRVVLR